MALNSKQKSLETHIDNRRAEPELDSEEDLEELESDVKKMAEKILEYRSTIPDQLKATLASVLSSQRPSFSDIVSEPGSSGELHPDSEETELEQRTKEKIQLLKEKISSNISSTPAILNRMKSCISRIEELSSGNGVIHPAFKKRKVVRQ
ncbi:F-box/kelch-repeat protein SKIP4-like [Hibiscus syriacus]|uniref:F-box/kelch-repeat protein SKIP4-like n=1 Tax=Hibiscus syriacus TaxID=106335 RepID=A0A6A2ZZW6_HIBSY|nr:uncharacterized protein LOC120136037 [Hibiscus syriacus]KAE8697580.1 F-box/kelch-repeat protein SKIP4-like [Hibiscus syriacus]